MIRSSARRLYRVFIVATLPLWLATFSAAAPDSNVADTESVGHAKDGRVVTPVNQLLTPYGRQLDLPGLRPQAVALSPNGKLLVTAGKTNEIIVVDPESGTIRQRVPLPSEELAAAPVSEQLLEPDKDAQLSYTGLIFSPDGARVYMSNVEGRVDVFRVTDLGKVGAGRLLEAAARGRSTPRRRDSQRPGDVRRRDPVVRLRQSLEPTLGIGH